MKKFFYILLLFVSFSQGQSLVLLEQLRVEQSQEAGYTYTPEIQAAIARANLESFVVPDETTLIALDSLIIRTKANGNYWNSRDVFLMFQYNNINYLNWSRINLKDATTPLITIHGGMTYTVNGWKGNGTNGYVNSKWTPSLSSRFTMASMGITHGFMGDYSDSNGRLVGIQNTDNNRRLGMFPSNVTNNVDLLFLNDYDYLNSFGSTNKTIKRVHTIIRDGNVKGRIEGSIFVSRNTPVVTPIITGEYYLNAMNNNNGNPTAYCDGTMFVFDGGGRISVSEVSKFKSDLNKYFNTIGTAQIN